jgi:hypothetical protein
MQTPATEVKWLITQTNWPVKSSLNVLDYHVQKHWLHYVISSFRREIDENCFVLRYYAACSGNSLPTFRDNLSVPSSLILDLKDGTNMLSRNAGKELLQYAA